MDADFWEEERSNVGAGERLIQARDIEIVSVVGEMLSRCHCAKAIRVRVHDTSLIVSVALDT